MTTYQETFLKEFPEYKQYSNIYITNNTKENHPDLSGYDHVVFFIPEPLKIGYIESVHGTTRLSNADNTNVTICCGSMNPDVIVQYKQWCKDNNTKPCNVRLMEMFKSVYTDFDEPIQYHITHTNRKKHFMCLNRGSRIHRTECVAYLWKKGLLDLGMISSPAINMLPKDTFSDTVKEWFEEQKNNLPYVVDGNHIEVGGAVQQELLVYASKVHFQIVTETGFYTQGTIDGFLNNDLFVTEKTYKTFFMGHPFVVLSQPSTISHVRKLGFDVFDDIINHDYDDIADDQKRLQAVLTEAQRLCTISLTRWNNIRELILPRLLENQRIYVDDLADMPKKI